MRKRLHVALIESVALHKQKCRQEFQKLDLSVGQPKVLNYLYYHEGCPQKELAEMCHVRPATMTSLLDNMEAKGLIRKASIICGGKRANGIFLTDLGRKKADEADLVMERIEDISLKGFTEDDKDRIIELLQKISNNLSEI